MPSSGSLRTAFCVVLIERVDCVKLSRKSKVIAGKVKGSTLTTNWTKCHPNSGSKRFVETQQLKNGVCSRQLETASINIHSKRKAPFPRFSLENGMKYIFANHKKQPL